METQGFSENIFREPCDAAVCAGGAELHCMLIRMVLVFWPGSTWSTSVKRDLLKCQKRPKVSKETSRVYLVQTYN